MITLVRGKGPPDDGSTSLPLQTVPWPGAESTLCSHVNFNPLGTTSTLWKPDQMVMFLKSQVHFPGYTSHMPCSGGVLLARPALSLNDLLKSRYCFRIQRRFSVCIASMTAGYNPRPIPMLQVQPRSIKFNQITAHASVHQYTLKKYWQIRLAPEDEQQF